MDFSTVPTAGLESSPVAAALAGLRANEARYFKNKYGHVFTVEPAGNARAAIGWVHRILREERGIVISSRPLEASAFQIENTSRTSLSREMRRPGRRSQPRRPAYGLGAGTDLTFRPAQPDPLAPLARPTGSAPSGSGTGLRVKAWARGRRR